MEQQVHASGHVFTGDYVCCAMKSSFPLSPVSTGELQFLTWAVGLFAPRQLMFHNQFARRFNQRRTAEELSRVELLESAEVLFRRSHVERLVKRVKDFREPLLMQPKMAVTPTMAKLTQLLNRDRPLRG